MQFSLKQECCDKYVNDVKSKTYETIKARHLEYFSEQFSKTGLTLENKGSTEMLIQSRDGKRKLKIRII